MYFHPALNFVQYEITRQMGTFRSWGGARVPLPDVQSET